MATKTGGGIDQAATLLEMKSTLQQIKNSVEIFKNRMSEAEELKDTSCNNTERVKKLGKITESS